MPIIRNPSWNERAPTLFALLRRVQILSAAGPTTSSKRFYDSQHILRFAVYAPGEGKAREKKGAAGMDGKKALLGAVAALTLTLGAARNEGGPS